MAKPSDFKVISQGPITIIEEDFLTGEQTQQPHAPATMPRRAKSEDPAKETPPPFYGDEAPAIDAESFPGGAQGARSGPSLAKREEKGGALVSEAAFFPANGIVVCEHGLVEGIGCRDCHGLPTLYPGSPFQSSTVYPIDPVHLRSRDPLHDIVDDLLELEDQLANAEPADQPLIQRAIDLRGEQLLAKADNIHHILSRMESQREAGKKERARIDARNRVLDKAHDRLEDYVLSVMDSRKIKDIPGETVTLTTRGSTPSVVIEDELAVPFEFNRLTIKMPATVWLDIMAKLKDAHRQKLNSEPGLKVDAEPDKTRIGTALKADPTAVPGAKMKPGRTLQRK
jgi:hypothetical protein